MRSTELLKLIVIILFGVVLSIFGMIYTKNRKRKKKQENSEMFNQSSESTSSSSEIAPEEDQIKAYIEQYKSQYSRDSIKSSLISAGNQEDKVEESLNKYF